MASTPAPLEILRSGPYAVKPLGRVASEWFRITDLRFAVASVFRQSSLRALTPCAFVIASAASLGCSEDVGGGTAAADTAAVGDVLDASSQNETTETADSLITDISGSELPSDGNDFIDDGPAALDLLNAQRIASALPVLDVDPTLSEGCEAHVAYMIAAGKLVREEDPAAPGYSEAGATAARNGVLASGMPRASDAAVHWFDSVYHRLALLDPGVQSVGFAYDRGFACLDVYSAYVDPGRHSPILWPGVEQENVPTTFEPVQGVTPIPNDVDGPTGPIISIMFPRVTLVGGGLVSSLVGADPNDPIDHLLRLPESKDDPWSEYQGNAVLLVPLAPLEPSTTFTVTVSGLIDGEESLREWSFTTAGATPPATLD